jgi:hypothetical protein
MFSETMSKQMQHVEDRTCVFCSEHESVNHLYFLSACIVVRILWNAILNIFDIHLEIDFESVARWWISNTKCSAVNIFSSAIMWLVWSQRNELYFQGRSWLGVTDSGGRPHTPFGGQKFRHLFFLTA